LPSRAKFQQIAVRTITIFLISYPAGTKGYEIGRIRYVKDPLFAFITIIRLGGEI
jgi:hypothetical protein